MGMKTLDSSLLELMEVRELTGLLSGARFMNIAWKLVSDDRFGKVGRMRDGGVRVVGGGTPPRG